MGDERLLPCGWLARAITVAAMLGGGGIGQQSPTTNAPPRARAGWTGTESTPHFKIHFHPGSRAEASVDRVAALVEDDLGRILRELDLPRFDHRIELWLYDDIEELQRVTGVPSAGHSAPLESHVPHDNDQTRRHELVHVVAEKFEGRGPEPRNLFFAEGLANALLRFVHGVHVDAVAAFHKRRGDLPDLATIHRLPDFYGWLAQHPHVNAYDIAGSWMRFLLDRHGAAKVRRYYTGEPIEATFGSDLATLEQQWHRHLDGITLRAGTMALLTERHGRTAAECNPAAATIGQALLGGDGWLPLADRELDGRPTHGDWCIQATGETKLGEAMVRAKVAPGPDCYGVRIDLGQQCQALLLKGQGTFIYTEKGGVAHDRDITFGAGKGPGADGAPIAMVLRRQQGRASLWIDGKLVLEAAVESTAAPFAVGCIGGPARFTAVAAKALP